MPPCGVLITQFRDQEFDEKSTAEKYKACKVDAVRASTAATPVYDAPYRPTPTIAESTSNSPNFVTWLLLSNTQATSLIS